MSAGKELFTGANEKPAEPRGAGGTERGWIHIVTFAIILTLTVHVIVNMEYPRMGFIRDDSFDQALVDVQASMK